MKPNWHRSQVIHSLTWVWLFIHAGLFNEILSILVKQAMDMQCNLNNHMKLQIHSQT